jgi:type IV pilus assembly protein PilW
MSRGYQKGFSLVELMIAILLAAVTAIVVLTVLSNYQRRSTALIGRNDAQISASVGLYAVEKEVRMAGAGLNLPGGQLCPVGVNIAYDGDAVADADPLMPLRIIDGGAGTDSLEVIRSDSQFGAAPTRLVTTQAGATGDLRVDGLLGFEAGDLVMVGASDGIKICTLMGVTGTTADGTGWLIEHDTAGSDSAEFNPADPAATFTTAITYDISDVAINMGRYGLRRYSVICNDGLAPAASNNCDLGWFSPLAIDPAAVTLADISSLTPQIVEMQAQYGVAPAGSQIVDEWVDATGADWAAPSLANQARIKAVRISIVARANRDGTDLAPASLVLWDDAGTANDRVRALSADERRFRYQVLTVVVPLINTIWAGV